MGTPSRLRACSRMESSARVAYWLHDLSHFHSVLRRDLLQGKCKLIRRNASQILEHRPELLEHFCFLFVHVAGP
jgi:hypothetical protein